MGSHHSSKYNSKVKAADFSPQNDSLDSKVFENISVVNIDKENQISESSFCSSHFNSRSVSSHSNSNSFTEKAKKFDDVSLPTLFIWDQGGVSVALTGDFSDWKNEYKMAYNKKENCFSLMLFLNKGVYQFKFLVDGKCRISQRYKVVKTKSGNLNNIIDNCEEIKKMDKFLKEDVALQSGKSKSFEQENKTRISDVGSDKNKETHYSNNPISHNPLKRNVNHHSKHLNKIPYANDFPQKGYLIDKPPSVPYTYSKPINVAAYDNEELLGSLIQTLPNSIKKKYENSDCYKGIKLPFHVNINHLLSPCMQYKNFYAINATQRIGKKFCTIVYCQPYNNEDLNSEIKVNFINNC